MNQELSVLGLSVVQMVCLWSDIMHSDKMHRMDISKRNLDAIHKRCLLRCNRPVVANSNWKKALIVQMIMFFAHREDYLCSTANNVIIQLHYGETMGYTFYHQMEF